MTKEQTVFGRLFFGNPTRAEREEKVLRYIIHRMNMAFPGGEPPQIECNEDARGE
jgi:hypothetical protein